MAKIGDNVPVLIDKAVDFMASSQAFREYLKKAPQGNNVPNDVPPENAQMYLQRLDYYRRLYQPRQEEKR